MSDDVTHEIRLLRTQSLPRLVHRHLEHMIFSGQILPGEKVNEVRIAADLGVSRGPVREAVRELEQAGYLEGRVQRGSYVREFTFDEILEVYEVRYALALQAGRLAAERITEKQIAEVEEMLRRAEAANRTKEMITILDLSFEFHKALMAATGNTKLADIYLNLHRQHRLFRLQALSQSSSSMSEELADMNQRGIAERWEIIDAIKSGDPDRAGKAYADYMLSGRERSRKAHEAAQTIHRSEAKDIA